MARRAGGTKRSSWLTFRRRLSLVRLLLRQPQTRDDLIAAVQAELGEHGYPEAAPSALKHDFDALKAEFGCIIRFHRGSGCYALEDLGDLALLDLSDTCMEALGFLEASFPVGVALPEHAGLHTLLDQLLLLLPPARRRQHRQRRDTITFELLGSAPGKIDSATLATVKRAIHHHQELTFDYLGPMDHGIPRRHRVAPYRIFFKPEGHGYLDATLLAATPTGNEPHHAAIDYRLDRILPGTARLLPTRLPPERPSPPAYRLRYRLDRLVAGRRDIATYFPGSEVVFHEDGSATVSARFTNLWQARQILLRYGAGCVVLEPPELIAMFQETARGLVGIYGGGDEPPAA
jgi:predicted DNA-binding transcriptional regulator YafY